MRIPHLLFSVPILFSILHIGCSKSDVSPDCRHAEYRGAFFLNPESKDIVPYGPAMTKIVFSDSLGNEYFADVLHYYTGLSKVLDLKNDTCLLDTVVLCELESISVWLTMWELGMQFQVFLMPEVSFDDQYELSTISDGLYVDLRFPFSDIPTTIVGVITDPRTNPDKTKTEPDLDTLRIHDKFFTDVYQGRKLDEGAYDLYYNAQFGIVGIENDSRSVSLKFERME
ncbi:MAG TPA: hypothetical protein VI603_12515 [Saprospiraceae bacterium]|nr:hypothetical protein [Saprospiraceae bacterium]